MSAQVAADLRAAADVLERDGWTQADYHEQHGDKVCHCTLGSLLTAVSGDLWALPPTITYEQRTERFDPAVEALTEGLGFDWAAYVADWNDVPGRTADEVIAALRAAADRAEAAS